MTKYPDLFIDIETYCAEPIGSAGRHRYAETAEVMLLAYAWADCNTGTYPQGAEVLDLTEGASLRDLAPDVWDALTDPKVRKHAFNASFERAVISKYFGLTLPPEQWYCEMVDSARHGLPLSLDMCGKAIGLPADQQKLKVGARLIQKFCKPYCGRRHIALEHPDEWAQFKEYCRRDVEAEIQIFQRLRAMDDHQCNLPRWEREVEVYDAVVNDRGVLLDRRLAEQATLMDADHRAALMAEAQEITRLDNPNSLAQLKHWIMQTTGKRIGTLTKADLAEYRAMFEHYPQVLRMLQIRAELGKTSVAKYKAMLDAACKDGRLRGLLQYYGTRTGRWAGRLVQLQNLPQNHLADINTARDLAKSGDSMTLELLYDSVPKTLSELIRTALVAPEGKELQVCDFSAIEARVIAWLAGEQWVLDVFREGGDIYCATASQMFGVPVSKHGPNAELRQKGKIAVLALGYGGGVNALECMGGARMGLTDAEMRDIVAKWRAANPHIVRFWRDVERSAWRTATDGTPSRMLCGLCFRMEGAAPNRAMTIELPSGRKLWYHNMRVALHGGGRFDGDGEEQLTFNAMNQITKQWGQSTTYGGKLTENIVQAVARDLLASTLLRCRDQGKEVIFHVHDEIVIEAPKGQPLEELTQLFSEVPSWASGLPLVGAGYRTPYYIKD